MFDVARRHRAGGELEERGKLVADRLGAGGQRLEARRGRGPTLEAAVEGLRDPGALGDVNLPEPGTLASIAEGDSDPPRKRPARSRPRRRWEPARRRRRSGTSRSSAGGPSSWYARKDYRGRLSTAYRADGSQTGRRTDPPDAEKAYAGCLSGGPVRTRGPVDLPRLRRRHGAAAGNPRRGDAPTTRRGGLPAVTGARDCRPTPPAPAAPRPGELRRDGQNASR